MKVEGILPRISLKVEGGYCSDNYRGTRQQLVSSGLVRAGQFPGDSGVGITRCTFYKGIFRPGRSPGRVPYDEDLLVIVRLSKDRFQVEVGVPKAEQMRRREIENQQYEQVLSDRRRQQQRREEAKREDSGELPTTQAEGLRRHSIALLEREKWNFVERKGYPIFAEPSMTAIFAKLAELQDLLEDAPLARPPVNLTRGHLRLVHSASM